MSGIQRLTSEFLALPSDSFLEGVQELNLGDISRLSKCSELFRSRLEIAVATANPLLGITFCLSHQVSEEYKKSAESNIEGRIKSVFQSKFGRQDLLSVSSIGNPVSRLETLSGLMRELRSDNLRDTQEMVYLIFKSFVMLYEESPFVRMFIFPRLNEFFELISKIGPGDLDYQIEAKGYGLKLLSLIYLDTKSCHVHFIRNLEGTLLGVLDQITEGECRVRAMGIALVALIYLNHKSTHNLIEKNLQRLHFEHIAENFTLYSLEAREMMFCLLLQISKKGEPGKRLVKAYKELILRLSGVKESKYINPLLAELSN